ncbi:MAG: acyltransferase, partial [Pseudomonas sp.]|nr:acyltransferase [Pseudomonas sp.]
AIPAQFIGKSYDQDPEYRLAFQLWINTLWEEKDQLLDKLKQDYPPKSR